MLSPRWNGLNLGRDQKPEPSDPLTPISTHTSTWESAPMSSYLPEQFPYVNWYL